MEAIEEERAAWELIPVILPDLSSASVVFLWGPFLSPILSLPAGRDSIVVFTA
jgi:hypothetical protein